LSEVCSFRNKLSIEGYAEMFENAVYSGAYSGKGFGGQPSPLFWENFFNLLGFLRKNSKNPPKFSRPYKKNLTPLENFLDTPLSAFTVNCCLRFLTM